MMDFKIIREEKMNVVLCSKQGDNHIKYNMENQDSLDEFHTEDSIAIAVADGVSSCKTAKKGAMAAVKTIEQLFHQIINNQIDMKDTEIIKTFIVRQWKQLVEEKWNESGTTLNFIIVAKQKICFGKIGDGLIAVRNGVTEVLSEEKMFFTTETYALGEVVLKKSLEVKTIDRNKEVPFSALLMTDGIAKELLGDSEIDLLDYLCELTEKTDGEIKNELSQWLKTLDKKNGDDKSIAILDIKE